MTADKAIAQFANATLVLLALFLGWGADVVATWSGIIAALATALSPLLVYFVANRPKAA